MPRSSLVQRNHCLKSQDRISQKWAFEQRATKAPAAEELTKQMEETLEQTKENIEKAKTCMKRQADKHRSQAPDYEIGDEVWLSMENLKLT